MLSIFTRCAAVRAMTFGRLTQASIAELVSARARDGVCAAVMWAAPMSAAATRSRFRMMPSMKTEPNTPPRLWRAHSGDRINSHRSPGGHVDRGRRGDGQDSASHSKRHWIGGADPEKEM